MAAPQPLTATALTMLHPPNLTPLKELVTAQPAAIATKMQIAEPDPPVPIPSSMVPQTWGPSLMETAIPAPTLCLTPRGQTRERKENEGYQRIEERTAMD